MNQKIIDAKIKQLNQNTNQFMKQNQQWINLLDNFNNALKVDHFSFNVYELKNLKTYLF